MYQRSEVKMPTYKPDGSQVRRHTLVWALEEASDLGMTMADIARKLDVTPQTLHIWKNRAKGERDFLLPAEQIPAMSKVLGIPPHYFRPDLWPNPKWEFPR